MTFKNKAINFGGLVAFLCLTINTFIMSDDLTIRKLAEKIAKDFQLTIKERVDSILEIDAISYQNLGTDSTKTEKNKVKSDSKYLYKLIRGIDEETGSQLINHMDK